MNYGVLEGLLFIVGDEGITLDEISKILEVDKSEAEQLINNYKEMLNDEKRGFKLVYLGNKYKLTTKEEHKKYYESLVDKTLLTSLTQTALETLVIIAYNGPISVGMIDEIRGVSTRDMVRKLLYRGFIEYAGRSDLPGKPMLYKTTDKFLDYFNLSSLDDLPELKEIDDIKTEETDLFGSKYTEKDSID